MRSFYLAIMTLGKGLYLLVVVCEENSVNITHKDAPYAELQA